MTLTKPRRLSSLPVGARFGRLTVVGDTPSRNGRHRTFCRCDCGTTRGYMTSRLTHGRTASCGCAPRDTSKIKAHGLTKAPEYRVWLGMGQRCSNPNHDNYPRYGGRGIVVCDRWRTSFENFYSDMGPRPSREHTIERKDVNGNYEPSNCIWLRSELQQRNTRKTLRLTLFGETKSAAEWHQVTGIPLNAIRKRKSNGWGDERTLTTPIRVVGNPEAKKA